MAKLEIRHNPQLTKERLVELFQQHFKGKYEVYLSKTPGCDFIVKKSGLSGVFVKLIQKQGKTQVTLYRYAPSVILRGPITMLFAGYDVMREVKAFMETSQEFK